MTLQAGVSWRSAGGPSRWHRPRRGRRAPGRIGRYGVCLACRTSGRQPARLPDETSISSPSVPHGLPHSRMPTVWPFTRVTSVARSPGRAARRKTAPEPSRRPGLTAPVRLSGSDGIIAARELSCSRAPLGFRRAHCRPRPLGGCSFALTMVDVARSCGGFFSWTCRTRRTCSS
jgi:hypothetical protein